jgi:large subunit ribosomal protein L23
MSSRLYPRYVFGNPQLRIFLPDFWMILVKPKKIGDSGPQPNKVTFRVHPRSVFRSQSPSSDVIVCSMTEHDVRNYLEKIYKLPVAHITSVLEAGEMPMGHGRNYLVKKYDYRLCHVYLPIGTAFKHPGEDLFTPLGKSESMGDLKRTMEKVDEGKKKFVTKTSHAGYSLPTWWGTSNH